MKIKLISIEDGRAAAEGWRLSRDYGTEVAWSDIMTVDVPVNELPTCHLHLDGMTILEREIFASSRSHVMWARTSHVDDPLAFVVPYGLESTNNAADRAVMARRKSEGASQDEWRENLPVTSLTSWTSRISFRDLVKMAGYFMRLGARPEIVMPVRKRFDAVASALGKVLDQFTGSSAETWRAVKTMRPVDFLSEKKSVGNAAGLIASDGFFLVSVKVPLWLRAQIVRHRPLAFVDNFFANVIASPDVLAMTIREPITMELAAEKEYWRSVLSKRSCWLAQDSLTTKHDPWQVIIDQFGFSQEMLPCANGTCPYAKDAALRLTDADPGAPCPRYLDINKIDKAPHRDKMSTAAKSRHSFWQEVIAR